MRFYDELITQPAREDSIELQTAIRETVDELLSLDTNPDRPGILLGKIQSGKTRGFIGIIAEAFSRGYELAVVLTKNSQLLGKQTTNRLEMEFQKFIEEGYFSYVHYVNTLHAKGDVFTPMQLMQKHIFVGIKNASNIEKIINIFSQLNPVLRQKKVLIVDDEADYGSIGFRRVAGQSDMEFIQTASALSQFRQILADYSFLQVTATPYSLYLQPEDYLNSGFDFKPLKPAFTKLLPIHSGYVGGEFYFEDKDNDQSPASHLHNTCKALEILTLSKDKMDNAILANIHITGLLPIFRKSIISFLVGVAIRRAQYILKRQLDENSCPLFLLPKFAFVFHIQTSKEPMAWQRTLVSSYLEYIIKLSKDQPEDFRSLYKEVIEDLLLSVKKGELIWQDIVTPPISMIESQIKILLEYRDYKIALINSDEKVIERTDKNGQLRLEAGMTFFIGGQVLDRGITIDNLIGFFYGRSPEVSKMDTILQHARMYGSRDKNDLCVTRFYTTLEIFKRMEEIHFMDTMLREQLQKKDSGIISIQRGVDGRIVPCDPSKIALSNLLTIKRHKRLLPYGFNVKNNELLLPLVKKIDAILESTPGFVYNQSKSFLMQFNSVKEILLLIDSTFSGFDHIDLKWDVNLYLDLIEKFLLESSTTDLHVYVKRGLEMGRLKATGDYISVPETSSTDGVIAKAAATDIPCLLLLGQTGRAANSDWNGGPFYWPVLYCPGNLDKPIIFTI